MDVDFVRKRISELRVQRGLSEYRMSTDLGHSKSYIQSISSGKSLPSLAEFFYICDYLNISPRDFFDTELEEPLEIAKLVKTAKELSPDDLDLIISLAERLNKK